ncbi:MAG TPA: dTDP-4-dehydrorhamnose reductase, partial [Polyangiaceae bacterium]|nr:dTDP-4-dehydrorhamnose reductase [Polyangiaceae bacterium]
RMKILLLGANGQLGYELGGCLATFAAITPRERDDGDWASADAMRRIVEASRPNVIVNACAYTDVDGAEREPEVAHHVNATMVGVLGEEAKRVGAGLVHFSTDFVFDGEKGTAYVETDPPRPLGEYARSKLAGEHALTELEAPALVLRTAWVYSTRRKSFVTTMLRLARQREKLDVVSDQIGSPTFCRDLAQATALLLYGVRKDPARATRDARGIYHLAGAGSVSRCDFARAILALDPHKSEHTVKAVNAIRSVDFPLPAQRPLVTPLDSTKARRTWGIELPPWHDALARALTSG